MHIAMHQTCAIWVVFMHFIPVYHIWTSRKNNLNFEAETMKTVDQQWKRTTRLYLGSLWVKNEVGVLRTLTRQQLLLPISVEAAKAQVMRLKAKSLSTVKKGTATTKP